MAELPSILDIRNIVSYFHIKKETDLDDEKALFNLLANYNGHSVIITSANDVPVVMPLNAEKQRVAEQLKSIKDQQEKSRLLNYLSTLNKCPPGKSIVCQQNSQNTDNIRCWTFDFPNGVTITKY